MEDIKNFLNKTEPLQATDLIVDAENIFLDFNFSHYPVLEEKIYLGSISKEDVEIFNTNEPVHNFKYSFHRFFVREESNWLDIYEEFAKNHTNILPVLDRDNNYMGFYELDDVLHLFNETQFIKENGGVIVVAKETSDYTFSQVCQIVENNDAKILGVFISEINGTTTQITLKISQTNFNEIIQTFRRYNYEIISEHQEDSYLQNLKDRSDYLDKYLNI